MDEGIPSYPRSAGDWWFGCGKRGSVQNDNGSSFGYNGKLLMDQPHVNDRDADLLDAGTFSQLLPLSVCFQFNSINSNSVLHAISS